MGYATPSSGAGFNATQAIMALPTHMAQQYKAAA